MWSKNSLGYQLGLNGNRTNLIETVAGVSRTNRWAYDPLYRLTNEVLLAASGSGTNAYTYDDVGNRLTRTTNGFTTPFTAPTNQTFNFDKSDRLDNDSNPDTASTLFDANGNTTNYAGTFRYDVENRLTNANNGAVIIVYNGDGLRVKKITSTKTNLYLVDTRNPSGYAQVLEELSVAGTTTNLSCAYTYGLDLISQRQPGVTTNFYGYDGQGSVGFLLTLAGSVMNTYVYDAYGMLLNSTGTITNNYRYCGEQFDADLGFYYLRARYFDPNIGRFQTMDTFGGNQSDPLSLHKYLYCRGNPVDGRDPSGHAVYFVEREMTVGLGPILWRGDRAFGGTGHGYLLFTSQSDPGGTDPFASGQPIIDSFSWHPNIWDYQSEEFGNPGVPGRVWENHPDDTETAMRGIPYRTFCVTANPAQQAILRNCIMGWINSMPVGYDIGDEIQDLNSTDSGHTIGSIYHKAAPGNGVYYSLFSQNCIWWATIMLKQSHISVPQAVYSAIAQYNGGYGAASQVISGQRSAYEANTMPNPFQIVPTVDDYIDASVFGAANFGFL